MTVLGKVHPEVMFHNSHGGLEVAANFINEHHILFKEDKMTVKINVIAEFTWSRVPGS